jgi:hypothetical protein
MTTTKSARRFATRYGFGSELRKLKRPARRRERRTMNQAIRRGHYDAAPARPLTERDVA